MEQSLPLVVWAVENASMPLADIEHIKRMLVAYCREPETLVEKDNIVVNIPRFGSIWDMVLHITLPPIHVVKDSKPEIEIGKIFRGVWENKLYEHRQKLQRECSRTFFLRENLSDVRLATFFHNYPGLRKFIGTKLLLNVNALHKRS